MWGQLCTELTNFQNFNVSFSTHKSEVLIHLSQWQYWWWFWFSFFWTFYFFTILRVAKHRVFKMNLIINTSFRSRGKWGDYLVTLIPLSWCLNILLNSNFILRMIEWQSESGAILIRIHGKQWYWVYKYDTTSIFSALDLYKNVGTNVWGNFTQKESSLSEKYIQFVFLKNRASAQQEYWADVSNKEFNLSSNFNVSNKLLSLTPLKVNAVKFNFDSINGDKDQNIFNTQALTSSSLALQDATAYVGESEIYKSLVLMPLEQPLNNLKLNLNVLKNVKNLHSFNTQTTNLSFYDNQSLDDSWEVYSNVLTYEASQPIKLLPTIQKHNPTDNNFSLITVRFLDSNELVVEKPEENTEHLVIKQKRYKRKQNINKYSITSTGESHVFNGVKLKNRTTQSSRFLKNNYLFQQISNTGAKTPFDFYTVVKLNRARSETFSINLARRLLRTTRTLVLPAYTNISIIANSYDVVHSWFIPGLGLKIDCVPGKSTHHSLYIDNIGLYYGQCAEICGRYHHHMPIRICALPFDHFIVWWTSKGLPKALKMKYNAKVVEQSLLVKYTW